MAGSEVIGLHGSAREGGPYKSVFLETYGFPGGETLRDRERINHGALNLRPPVEVVLAFGFILTIRIAQSY